MELEFVFNQRKYWDFIRNLRNLNINDGFVESIYITEEMQNSYMEVYGIYYYICLYKQIPVGFIGSIEGDIRLATLPEYSNMGIGTFMLNNLMNIYPNSFAKIKTDNNVSRKFFEKNGFIERFVIYDRKEY